MSPGNPSQEEEDRSQDGHGRRQEAPEFSKKVGGEQHRRNRGGMALYWTDGGIVAFCCLKAPYFASRYECD